MLIPSKSETQASKSNNYQLPNLKDFLHTTGNIVVLGSDNVGVHDTGGWVQGVDSGVDTQLSDGTGQHSGGVQVSEGGGGGRVSQIISRHIDGLEEKIIQFYIILYQTIFLKLF